MLVGAGNSSPSERSKDALRDGLAVSKGGFVDRLCFQSMVVALFLVGGSGVMGPPTGREAISLEGI